MCYNKQCKCGNFIPDEYDTCDSCLLSRYHLLTKGKYDSSDPEGLGERYYPEPEVIRAIREAERR